MPAYWTFLREYFTTPTSIGSLVPSSRALALAICTPLAQRTAPATILEVGAGTGAVTREVVALMGPDDRFDICEVNAAFADEIEQAVLAAPHVRPAASEGRVRLLRFAVEELGASNKYDFVLSCLPLTSFRAEQVRSYFGLIMRALKPRGIMSYFEYCGLRRLRRTLSIGASHELRRRSADVLDEFIYNYQFQRDTVLWNLPPAHARHLRFDS